MRIIAATLRILAAAAILFGLAAPARAEGTRHALLVGVSDYPATAGFKPLRGPRNDVQRMHRLLVDRGFDRANITVLADGVDIAGAQDPTRARIMAALNRLVHSAKPGDFIYIHFAGHGSQQPALGLPRGAEPEPDGSSEIFLPIDIAGWDDKLGAPRNAIVDHELVAILERLIERGAFVWSVFDACHSATLMRAADEDVRVRQVDPSALDIPDSAWAEARRRAATGGARTRGGAADAAEDPLRLRTRGGTGKGGYVSFYGAQTTEEAPEMPMPLNLSAGDPRKRQHGVLSYTLAEALETLDGLTYRQLADFILQRYAVQNISKKPTPAFSGSGLDAPVFGSRASGPVVRQWRTERRDGALYVRAGLLSQVSEGALLDLYATPQAKQGERIGQARVMTADMVEARIELVADAKEKPQAVPDAAYARLVRPNVAFTLRVAIPPAPAAGDALGQQVRAAVAALAARSSDAARIEWVAPGKTADLRLHVEDGRLWFVPAAGRLDKGATADNAAATPSIPLQGTAEDLERMLGERIDRVAKALRLMRAVQTVGTLGAGAGPDIKLTRLPGGRSGAGEQIRPGSTPRLRAGDEVQFEIANRTSTAFDLTLLYVDAEYGITPQFPVGGGLNRIEPGATLRSAEVYGGQGHRGILLTDDPLGTERLIVLAVPAQSQDRPADFSFLAQPGIAVRTRAQAPELEDWFGQAVFEGGSSDAMRGGPGGASSAGAVARMYAWEVVKGAVKRYER